MTRSNRTKQESQMARPKKALEIADADITIAEPVEAGWAKPDEILPEVMLAKTVQLHVGVDLLGSKASLQSGRMLFCS